MTRRLSICLALAAALMAGCGSSSSSSSSSGTAASSTPATTSQGTTSTGASSTSTLGFEGMPLETGAAIAPASTTQTGTVDGITCGPIEQLAYHIHAHLAVFANGAPRSVPTGIGIPGSVPQQTQYGPVAAGGQCIYWLHTHTSDGVIHIESPTARIYSLGEFFDIWHQPLSSTKAGTLSGKVSAFVNGKPWTKDPRSIPLLPHAAIQLDVGSADPPPQPVSWAGTQL